MKCYFALAGGWNPPPVTEIVPIGDIGTYEGWKIMPLRQLKWQGAPREGDEYLSNATTMALY